MKAGFLAIAAAVAAGVEAKAHHHNHKALHAARGAEAEGEVKCVVTYITQTVESHLYTSMPAPPPAKSSTAAAVPSSKAAPVPTPVVTVCPTPGVYTFPETTITLTETTTVCAATSTSLPAGVHTYGGVTTVILTSTTVVCPYAHVTTNSGVVTSTIMTTTLVCPTPGTYTIAPLTTECTSATVAVYPTPCAYAPGTYIQPEVVTTITETDYVVFCPYTSSEAPIPAPTSAASKPTAAAPSPSAEVPKTGTLGTSGDKWATTFTPYTSSGDCMSASEVDEHISSIKSAGFTTIRLYSTDCNGLENVGTSCANHGLGMIVGVFIKDTGIAGAQPQVDDLCAFKHWDIVELVVVGNECISSGYCGAPELASFITSCKTAFQGSGYTGPVTTTEPLSTLQQHSGDLCSVVDVVGCNIHAFFNADVEAADAGSFVKGQLDIVDSLCPGKTGINLETGWPSAGTCNGKACPSSANQAAAISSIHAACGGSSVMFSWINDEWKAPGAFDCEQSWGIQQLY